MEQETHEPLEYKNEAFKKKLEQFFTGFADDSVGKQQFFLTALHFGMPPADVNRLSYLFHGTNEQHIKLRNLKKEQKNDTIHWASDPFTALCFLNARIFERNLEYSSPEILSTDVSFQLRPDAYQPVLCIAKAPAILKEIKRKKRSMEKLARGAHEEILITTGTLEEGEDILHIKSPEELIQLSEFLISVSPYLKENKNELKNQFTSSFALKQWQKYEKLIQAAQTLQEIKKA